MIAEVNRHADCVACRLAPAQEMGAVLHPGALLAEVAGVEMTPAPRRPAAVETALTALLQWQPYGVRTDASSARIKCAHACVSHVAASMVE